MQLFRKWFIIFFIIKKKFFPLNLCYYTKRSVKIKDTDQIFCKDDL